MRLLTVVFVGLMMCSTPALAESLICSNDRRAYNLVYETGSSVVILNPDGPKSEWRVLSKVQEAQVLVVIATANADVTANVHLHPAPKVVFFANGEMLQTNMCKATGATSEASSEPKQMGFGTFLSETKKLNDLISCSRPKVTKTHDWPDLWGCVFPGADVVKLFANANDAGGVSNVKLIWNDWTRDVGYGIHTDRKVALKWAKKVALAYAPDRADDIVAAFFGTQARTIENDAFRLIYSYRKGPSIDERMLTITTK